MNPFKTLLTVAALWLVLAAIAHAGTVTYVYSDPQGTPLAEADANGNITATFDYRPYGVQALGAAPNGPGYTGHVNDPDTGLVYMQARYYDPVAGRFISTDPVGPSAGGVFKFNRFAYVDNNPIVNIDPDGQQEVPADEPSEPGVDAAGNSVLGPNMRAASPFEPMPNESSSDFDNRQQAAFERMDSTPEKNARDDAKAKSDAAKYSPMSRFGRQTKRATAERASNKCEYCGTETVPAKRSQRGVTPPSNEGQTDHVVPRSKGGTNDPDNAAHSCRACNIRNSDKPKPHPRNQEQGS